MDGQHASLDPGVSTASPSFGGPPEAVSSLQRRLMAFLGLLAILFVALFGVVDAYLVLPGPSVAPLIGLAVSLAFVAIAGHFVLQPSVDAIRSRMWDLQEYNEKLSHEAREHIQEVEEYAYELERSNEDLERFAQAASHDLREPVRMISAYLQLIEDRYEDLLDEEGEEFLGYAIGGAQRLDNLITGLLNYATTGGQAGAREPVDLTFALEDATSNLQLAIQETGATIRYDRLPTVQGHRTQLAQLFQNLIENAIKFRGDDPPTITIRAVEEEEAWVIHVQDNGIGFDADREGRIFDIFQRGASEGSGPGVGLAICKRIIDYHQGEIWAEAKPGEGATFTFTLPKASGSSLWEGSTSRPSRPQSLEERSELLI